MGTEIDTRRILFVCTANICRSYMAEAIMRSRSRDDGRRTFVASSAGIRLLDLPIDPQASLALAEEGLAFEGHEPRLVDRSIIRTDGADLIVTMTREHLRHVVATDRESWPRVFTLRELARRVSELTEPIEDWHAWLAALGAGRSARDMVTEDPRDDVVDPYGLSMDAHRECLRVIRGLLDHILVLAPVGGT